MKQCGWTVMAAFVFARAALGLSIVNYDSAQFDRFASGFSTAPVPNTSAMFIGSGYDFSGVGWNDTFPLQSIAMINDQYFIGANHFMPSAGTVFHFFSPTKNAVVSYTVDNYSFRAGPVSPITGESGDLAIGRLTSAINSADGIAAYPILDLSSYAPYIGLPLLVYGHGDGVATNSPRIGTNTLDAFYNLDIYPIPDGNGVDDSIEYAYSSSASPTGEASLQGWDSGGPTFTSWYGQLALVGTHSAVGTISGVPNSFDNFVAPYLDQIESAGISFETVPEPSRMMLALLAMGACFLKRRRAHSV